jgi:Tfp pilus assembly protein FimT
MTTTECVTEDEFWSEKETHIFEYGRDIYTREQADELRTSARFYARRQDIKVRTWYTGSYPHRRLYINFYGRRQVSQRIYEELMGLSS